MSTERRQGPVEMIRNLALSLERLAAHEAASGVVRGAADGLRQEMPELEGQLRTLLQDTLTVLGRLAHEAAEREQVEPGAVAHSVATATMKGLLEVLEREWQDGGLPLHSFVERLNRLLDGIADFTRYRADAIRAPGERAQAMTEAMVKAAVRQFGEEIPALSEELQTLAPLGAELASKVGWGLVAGMESKLRENPDVFGDLLENAGRKLVRGLAAGLREELASRDAQARNGTLRRVTRELTRGALEALGASLRRPLLAVASAGSLMTLALLSVQWRRHA